MRLVLSYKVGFERERVLFGQRDHVLEVGDIVHHRLHFRGLGGMIEVLPHAVFQHYRLSDVNDIARLVVHYINAAVFWQIFDFFFESHSFSSRAIENLQPQ